MRRVLLEVVLPVLLALELDHERVRDAVLLLSASDTVGMIMTRGRNRCIRRDIGVHVYVYCI